MKNTIVKCPLCLKFSVHEKYVQSHLVRCHAHAVDLLAPWKIPKRRRGSNMIQQEMMMFVAARAPLMDPVATRLPMKKRVALIIHMARQHSVYICHMCGRRYTEVSALGEHKAHHTRIRERLFGQVPHH